MRTIKIFFYLIILFICGIILSFVGTYLYIGSQLPVINTLINYQTQTPLRIYSIDHKLIAEFGDKRSLPVSYNQIPQMLINAILAAEDSDFNQHHGINISSIVRAASEIIKTGKIKSGGSTITMQVAKNYLLSSEKSFERKIKEILLSIQIERSLTKEQIFELYVNKIYLGNKAYGVAAAAEVYYGKTLDQLNIAECAMIAGLPKAPSSFNPLVNPTRSLERRNWILGRMLKLHFIDLDQYQTAINTHEIAKYYQVTTELYAPYAAENARQEIFEQYGDDTYNLGLDVITSIDSKIQESANQAIVNGLIQYDQKYGFLRKPINVPPEKWQETLTNTTKIAHLEPAIISALNNTEFTAITKNEQTIKSDITNTKWLKARKLSNLIKVGDLIYVTKDANQQWQISQLPNVQAALLTLNPKNGAILAMVGGLSFEQSKYNRAVQAKRQTGSVFKPFVYSAALDKKYTASSIINDAPLLLNNDYSNDDDWRPKNSTDNFLGPIRLREALYRSRNLVSIRLLNSMGIEYTRNYLTNFGFDINQLPNTLSLSLGTASLTPLEITTGFSVFANNGYKANPYLIKQIKKRINNKILWEYKEQPQQLVIDPRTAFIVHSILKDVVNRGTAFRVKELGRTDLAGKTGTTNDSKDTWFVGYNPSFITTVWTGFDNPSSLGNEFGATFALPIWMEHMKNVLQNVPIQNIPVPPGIIVLDIDVDTGERATSNSIRTYREYFKSDNLPENSYSEFSRNPTNKSSNANEIDEDALNDIF